MVKLVLQICSSAVIAFAAFVVVMLVPVIPAETGAVVPSGTVLKLSFLPLAGYVVFGGAAGGALKKFWYTDLVAVALPLAGIIISVLLIRRMSKLTRDLLRDVP